MEEAKILLQEARDNITEAIEILKEECPSEVVLQEELRQNKIELWEKIHEINLLDSN